VTVATATRSEPKVYTIPAGTKAGRCKGAFIGGRCSALIYWITDQNGLRRIIEADVPGGKRPSEAVATGQFDLLGGEAKVFDGRGIDHHSNCPDVELFRRRTP
jgi:hypothetical protein